MAILNLSNAISRKRCNIGATLVLITNRKANMSFRLVPNSVTLDDLERRKSPKRSVISQNSVASGTDCVKVVKDTQILSPATCRPKNVDFSDINVKNLPNFEQAANVITVVNAQ